MAKGFREKAAGTPSVYSTVIGRAQEELKPQDTPRQAPPAVVPHEAGTQGRKGAKLPRINMAFSQQSLDYLRVMSALKGMSITRYVNDLIEQDMARNAEMYNAAQHITHQI